MTDRFSFDMQRFGGGKGGTTVTQTYEPTPYEMELQRLEVEYTAAIMPSAKALNTYAYSLLINSGGTIPVHYDLLYDDADAKIETGLDYLQNLMLDLTANPPPTFLQDRSVVEQFNDNYINEVLGYNDLYLHGTNDLFSWMNDVPRELYQDLRTLKSGLLSFTQAVMETYQQAAVATNSNLAQLPSQWTKAQDESHRQLAELDDKLNGKTIMNYADLDELIPQFRDAADDANKNLDDIREKMGEKAETNYQDLDSLVPLFTDAADDTNTKLADINSKVDDKANMNYKDLDDVIPKFVGAANKINLALDGLDDDAADRMNKHFDNFDKIIPHFLPAARRTNIVLEDLETGKVPTQWQRNMQESIRLALENTIGKTVNDHGQRGVLNSSVTNQALYDIERNAADEVARQYLANIHEIAGMAEQRWKNTEDALNDMKNSYNEQFGGYLNGIGQRGQIKQNEFNNLNTALVNQGNTFNSQFGNASNALNQRSQLEETSHNNLTGAYLNQENIFNAQLQNWLNSLMQRSQLVENEHNNLTGAYLNQENTFNAQFQNALNALMQMAQLDENAKNNLMTALVNKMNAYNSQISNWLNTTAQRAGYVNQQFGAVTNSLNAHAQLYGQLLNNANAQLDAQLKAKQTEFQLNGDMWMRILQALKQRNDMCGQWYEYSKNISDALWQHSMMALEAGRNAHNLKLSHLQIWNALISMYLGNSTSRITMSAGAQEAAQNAAIRLWNASTGLNQSATGVLVALSNQGTKTTTQQESSSSFWGGLFGGVASAFAGGYAGALGSAK